MDLSDHILVQVVAIIIVIGRHLVRRLDYLLGIFDIRVSNKLAYSNGMGPMRGDTAPRGCVPDRKSV